MSDAAPRAEDAAWFDAGESANSGVRKMTAREVRVLLEARDESNEAEARARRARRTLAAIVAAVLTTVTGTVSTLAFAQGRIDAGVAPVRAELESYRKDAGQSLRRLEVTLEALQADMRLERDRQDARWERLLLRMKIRDPSPSPKDEP